jgi:hypothetical protein
MSWWLIVCTKKGIQDEDVQIGKHLLSIYWRLCEHGNFSLHVGNRGRPRPRTPEVQEDILDVVNETTGISTRRIAFQVGVVHLSLWRVFKKTTVILTICSVYRPCHYKITLLE